MSSMEMEVSKEEESMSIQLQLGEQEGGAKDKERTSSGGGGGALGSGTGSKEDLNLHDLTSSIQKLTLKDDTTGTGGRVRKKQMSELISTLEKARVETADGERQTRRAIWNKEQEGLIRDLSQFQGTPEKLLPEVVWRGVLLQVNVSSKDRARVSKMSEMWRDLLKKDRTRFLFHEVLPILHQRGRMSSADLLRSRRVCKEWKSSLGTFLQSIQDFSITPEEDAIKSVSRSSNREPVLELWFTLDFTAVKRFLRWSKRTYPPAGNPFISRNLSLGQLTGYPPPPPEIQVQIRLVAQFFWAEVERLLKQWGREVWQVILIFEGGLHPVELYDRLCKMLKLMPNLKSLMIQKDIEEFDVNPEVDMRAEYKLLEKRMAENPLPEMGHLHTIIAPLVHPPILKGMLSKFGSTLETLSTGGGVDETLNVYVNSRILRFKQFFISAGDCIVPESGINVEWPSIQETGFMLKEMAASSIPPLFQMLNGFGGTLKKLTLVLHSEEGPLKKLEERAVKMLSLELPHLEELTFSVCRINLKTIDFMFPLTSLRVLSVNYMKFVASFEKKEPKKNSDPVEKKKAVSGPGTSEDADDSGEIEIIKFSNYTNRLYESNIWKLFPELKKVSIAIVNRLKKQQQTDDDDGQEEKRMVKRKIYTLEGYKQHCSEL